MRPVLRRADSVMKMRDAVLDFPATAYAAHRLDDAIDAADLYVERFLPDENQQTTVETATDANGSSSNNSSNGGSNSSIDTVDASESLTSDAEPHFRPPAMETLQRGRRFSRKLTRRLTLRTIHEARALRHGGEEAVHIVSYALRLLVTDPRLACHRVAELWEYLSDDEPDNQARPHTLEQLLVLLLRESARRAVHVCNWMAHRTTAVPR